MSQTRRIFFNLTPIANNLEIVNEQLNTINLKLQNKIQILLAENQQLNNNLKFRGPHKDMEKLKDKVDKLKLKVKEVHNLFYRIHMEHNIVKIAHGTLINLNDFILFLSILDENQTSYMLKVSKFCGFFLVLMIFVGFLLTSWK